MVQKTLTSREGESAEEHSEEQHGQKLEIGWEWLSVESAQYLKSKISAKTDHYLYCLDAERITQLIEPEI